MPVIQVENLSKIFGKNAKRATKFLDEGLSKEEILEKSGNTVGVNRASFDVEEGKSLSLWDCLEVGSQRSSV